jgi:hypothetical protein
LNQKEKTMVLEQHICSRGKYVPTYAIPQKLVYLISFNFKPTVLTRTGKYRRTVYGKSFDSREDAQNFLNENWMMLTRQRKLGECVQSVCIESMPA